ncbi:putative methyltransferase TARBP1 [Auxenochlorella protothecoides]|uniref:Putative methyltransferase TARBP1 n=1 Tax=Auxenochlorella protothecoides TaxID=3075 RepID=A0A087SSK6_AUXPR|nr:putative methyltransferase TARBP1 [Auxenochlorella protothecoides]KFM28710.1 putative methyltransferase TARBP1 [Auxenochlorella protothecoides]
MALALLVQFARDVQPSLERSGTEQTEGLAELSLLVVAIRDCLVHGAGSDVGCDPEPVNRKRALHILTELGPCELGMSQQEWNVFSKLLGVSEEYSLHLFQEGWGSVDALHRPRSGPEPSPATPPCLLPFDWMAVLWGRGFAQPNQSAGRQAVLSFFARAWDPPSLCSVPAAWAAGVLVPAVGAPHMAKGRDAGRVREGSAAWAEAWGQAAGRGAVARFVHASLRDVANTDLPRSAVAAAAAMALAAVRGMQQRGVSADQQQHRQGGDYSSESNTGEDLAACANTLEATTLQSDMDKVELLGTCADVAHALRGQGTGRFALDTWVAMLGAAGALCALRSGEARLAVPAAALLRGRHGQAVPPSRRVAELANAWLAGAAWSSTAGKDLAAEARILATLALLVPDAGMALEPLDAALASAGAPPSVSGSRMWQLLAATFQACPPDPGGESPRSLHAWARQAARRCLTLAVQEPLDAGVLLCQGEESKKDASGWLARLQCTMPALQLLPEVEAPADRTACLQLLLRTRHDLMKSLGDTQADAEMGIAQASTLDALLALACPPDPGGESPRSLHAWARQAARRCLTLAVQEPLDAGVLLCQGEESKKDASGWLARLQCTMPALQLLPEVEAPADRTACLQLLLRTRHDLMKSLGDTQADAEMGIAQASTLDALLALVTLSVVLPPSSACLEALMRVTQVSLPESAPGRDPDGWRARAAPLSTSQRSVLSAWRAADAMLSSSGQADRSAAAWAPPDLLTHTLAEAAAGLAAAPDPQVLPLLRIARALLPLALAGKAAPLCPESEGACHLLPLVSALAQGGFKALRRSSRRKTGLTAALVSTCLHPDLFDVGRYPGVACLHDPATGPVHHLITQLLAAGRRSCRMASLTALQLAGCWSLHPASAAHYTDTLRELCLYGFADDATALNGADDAVVDPETLLDLAAVRAPPDGTLAEAHAATELAPRVATLCLLHAWVQQAQQLGEDKLAADSRRAGHAAWAQLLHLALHDPELSSPKYQFKGTTHRRKASAGGGMEFGVRLWQALAVLCPLIVAQSGDPALLEEALDQVMSALTVTKASTVKQYQEVVAVVLLRATPDAPTALRARVLSLLCDCRTSKRDDLPSLILIASQFLLLEARPLRESAEPGPGLAAAAPPGPSLGHSSAGAAPQATALAREVVPAIVPWALSHVHPVRTFAQLALWRLLETFPQVVNGDPALVTMLGFFSSNTDVQRLRTALGLGQDLDSFDPERATCPAGVLYKGVALAGRSDELSTFEGALEPLVDAIAGFLVAERLKLRIDMKDRLEASVHEEYSRASAGRPCIQPSQPPPAPSRSAAQRKITPAGQSVVVEDPWAATLGFAPLAQGSLDDFEANELAPALREAGRAGAAPRQRLIVVASLVDKLPNLAGLARTCEVFRATALVVADASIVSEPQFQSISVSANLWMPIQEVPEVELAPWLQEKAAQGWTLDFVWPEKTVLVLGREKEGIPAHLLARLQATVEIPQLGLIRSLNVHVSGAIAAYEFTRQGLAGRA